MDAGDLSRITQNIVYLKNSLSHLDPLIDMLIETEIFVLADRNRIESDSTQHQQFNKFINILTSSANGKAYRQFRRALGSLGYAEVVDKLDKTTPKQPLIRSASSRGSNRPASVGTRRAPDRDEAGAANVSSPSRGCGDCSAIVTEALEAFGHRHEAMIENIERQRQDDRRDMERHRRQDRQLLLDQKGQWEAEKLHIRMNMDVIDRLTAKLEDASELTTKYLLLQENYEHLQEIQKGMRETDRNRQQRLSTLNQDVIALNRERQQLKDENEALRMEISHLKNIAVDDFIDDGKTQKENEMVIEELTSCRDDLLRQVEDKISENKDLQEKLDERSDLTHKHQEESQAEKDVYIHAKHVEQKLDKIFTMVENMSTAQQEVSENKKSTNRPPPGQLACTPRRMNLAQRNTGTKPVNVQFNT